MWTVCFQVEADTFKCARGEEGGGEKSKQPTQASLENVFLALVGEAKILSLPIVITVEDELFRRRGAKKMEICVSVKKRKKSGGEKWVVGKLLLF